MLYNLEKELSRKGLNPVSAISQSIDCTDDISKDKLNGLCDISVQEAIKIKNTYFFKDDLSVHYLFSSCEQISKEMIFRMGYRLRFLSRGSG